MMRGAGDLDELMVGAIRRIRCTFYIYESLHTYFRSSLTVLKSRDSGWEVESHRSDQQLHEN